MRTYITRITLQGFKSFNRKISIPFSPNLNIITGPNGSGKSNIIDAVSFVLGRISAKSLRADRLTELIFRGTETKKPAEYASVTLYLDNSKKIFPFEDSEISITRKVNRNGYTVYKINGKNTTREKVLELLSLIKVRPDGYNIIPQGDVTRVIEMSPQERREIIDEIAGIAEYNDKKEKALRDLEEVDKKLREVEIIVTQKYEIFKKLEEEKNLVLKYQNLQKELLNLKASYWKKKEEIITEKLKEIEKKIEEIKKKIEECENEIKEKEQKLFEYENSLKEIVKNIIEFSKRAAIEDEASKLRTRLILIRERIDVTKKEIERLENLIAKLEMLEAKRQEFTREMSRPVKEILNLKIRGVYGTIADLIKVEDTYKVAIEVAAAQHLYDIVVENEDVAITCIDFLKREKIGRATFIPLNKIKPQEFKEKELLDKEGVIGLASKLISYDRKFQPAIDFVFGNTLIIENLDVAKNIGIGRVRMVTLDGDLIERSGAMTGGYLVKESSSLRLDKEEIEKYRQAKINYLSELENLKKEEEEIEKRLKELKVSEESKKIIDLEKVRISSEREIERLRELRRKLQDRRINLEMEQNKYAIEKAKLETELENVKKEVEKYVGGEIIDLDIKQLEKRIKEVEEELNKIGNVNFKALEEYEQFKKEFEDLKIKYDKILDEKKSVLKMIEEIESKKREVFFSTLKKVSEEFSKIFKEMCNGEGSLRLEDENNLDSGLIIEATFPQKRPINIDALSGGEKTLTAIAFLFALQRFSPSEFYLLDEIDAALDKENTLKVAEWLKKESKNTQFIVISHNDITLKHADKLYGCTLEEGETKVLAIELPQ
ncbi:MAG: chromosome segregation SMC family protein [Candidatus Aenigmatarchaeota archaeon]